MRDDRSIFIDTNVLVYAALKRSLWHEKAVSALRYLHDREIEMWLSRQIIREYLSTMSRPGVFADGINAARLVDDINGFLNAFLVADETEQVTQQLLNRLPDVPVGGKQIHDANIVATMCTIGVRQLLTNNVSDFTRFASEIEIVPLESFDLVKNQFS